MLREFAESPQKIATPTHTVVPTALRAFIAYCMLSVTTGEQISSVSAQEPRMQTPVTANLEANEHQQSYASIEEWLERSPVSLRAKKALTRIKGLENDDPSIREQAQKDIIESLQKVQNAILPVPEEFMQPLREKYIDAANKRNTDLFYLCQRIIQTIEMNERDAPSTIPSHINYLPEKFPQVLSRHLGLTIEGLTDELSTKLIAHLSQKTRTPASILSKIIQEDFFIEIEPNGGEVRIRRRVSSHDQQKAYDSGSICLVTTLNAEDSYRETDALRPRNRGPLLAVYPIEHHPYYFSALLHRVHDVVTRSPDYRKGKHSVALPRPKNYAKEVPGPDLPLSAVNIQPCNCVMDGNDAPALGFVHAKNPSQISLKNGIQTTPVLSVQTERKNGTMTITMTPQAQQESDVVSHSNICCLAGWSRFSTNGKMLPARMSMQNDTIVWTIDVPDEQPVDLHTYLGMDLSSTKLPSHP